MLERSGGEVVRRIVSQSAQHLNEGGWCQVLANWVHLREQDWRERLQRWIPDDCDAWVLQRERVDLPTYVEMWLADAGLHGAPGYPRRYDQWLSWFDEQGIEAIGFGWLSLHRAGRDVPVRRLEEWSYEIEQPVGPAVSAWAARTDALPGVLRSGYLPVVRELVVEGFLVVASCALVALPVGTPAAPSA